MPDPATARESVWTEQFHNPYLAMGNNPDVFVDDDGEFIMMAAFIGLTIIYLVQGFSGNVNSTSDALLAMRVGAASNSKYTDQVYKVPTGGEVLVKPGGEVKLFLNPVEKNTMLPARSAYARIFQGYEYRYGWLPADYFISINSFDNNWQFLYKAARLIQYFPDGY